MIVFIILFILSFFVLSLKRLDWALMLVLAGLPLYVVRFNIFGIPSTLLESMILIIFFVWFTKSHKSLFKIINYKIKNYKLKINNRYPFDTELILVLIISFVSMGVSGFSNSAMGIWKAYFFEPIIVYLLIFNIFFVRKEDNKEQDLNKIILKIILPLSISAFIVSVFAIYQKITGNFIPGEFWSAVETRRITSFFGYPNAVGLFLGPISIMIFAYLLSIYKKYKQQSCRVQCEKWSPFSTAWFKLAPTKEKMIFIFLKLTFLQSLLAIYFAKSEGAMIAIVVAILLIIFLAPSWKSFGIRRFLMSFVMLFTVVIVFSFAPLKNLAVNRLSLNDFSGQIRKAQWQDTGIMLRDGHWFLGAGLANYQKVIKPYHSGGVYIKNNDPDFERLIKISPEYQAEHWQPLEIFLYPHNIFLNFWVELGLLGMLLFLWIIFKVFYISLKFLASSSLKSEDRYLLLGAMSAMFVVVVHGIVDVPYFKNDLAVILWLIVAMIGVVQLKIKNYELKIKDEESREKTI